jgi:hypothetical protein
MEAGYVCILLMQAQNMFGASVLCFCNCGTQVYERNEDGGTVIICVSKNRDVWHIIDSIVMVKMSSGIFGITVSVVAGILRFDVLTLHFHWLHRVILGRCLH